MNRLVARSRDAYSDGQGQERVEADGARFSSSIDELGAKLTDSRK